MDTWSWKFIHQWLFLTISTWYKQVLLEYGANVNAENNNGEIPLLYAVQQRCPNTVQVLLQRGKVWQKYCTFKRPKFLIISWLEFSGTFCIYIWTSSSKFSPCIFPFQTSLCNPLIKRLIALLVFGERFPVCFLSATSAFPLGKINDWLIWVDICRCKCLFVGLILSLHFHCIHPAGNPHWRNDYHRKVIQIARDTKFPEIEDLLWQAINGMKAQQNNWKCMNRYGDEIKSDYRVLFCILFDGKDSWGESDSLVKLGIQDSWCMKGFWLIPHS